MTNAQKRALKRQGKQPTSGNDLPNNQNVYYGINRSKLIGFIKSTACQSSKDLNAYLLVGSDDECLYIHTNVVTAVYLVKTDKILALVGKEEANHCRQMIAKYSDDLPVFYKEDNLPLMLTLVSREELGLVAQANKDSETNLETTVIVRGRYIGNELKTLDLSQAMSVAIKTPIGSGKTQFVIQSLKASGVKRILVIVNRVSAVINIIARFREYGITLTHYNDEVITLATESVATCCNSLSKLPFSPEHIKDFAVVIEESEQVYSQLVTMTKYKYDGATRKEVSLEEDYLYLRMVIGNASVVIMDDAFLGDISMSHLRELRKDLPLLNIIG